MIESPSGNDVMFFILREVFLDKDLAHRSWINLEVEFSQRFLLNFIVSGDLSLAVSVLF